ncbi:hypothetical protein IWZ01DRAFT_485455 [Phyllosticta capitalensis]
MDEDHSQHNTTHSGHPITEISNQIPTASPVFAAMASTPTTATAALDFAKETLAEQQQLLKESRTFIEELAADRREKKRRVELATTRANSREAGWLAHTRERVQTARDDDNAEQVMEAMEIAKITIGYVIDARKDLQDEKEALKKVTKQLNAAKKNHTEIKDSIKKVKDIMSKLKVEEHQKSGGHATRPDTKKATESALSDAKVPRAGGSATPNGHCKPVADRQDELLDNFNRSRKNGQ